MKKNLTIFVAVLLLLCVLTAALKITQRDKDGGLIGSGAITGGLDNNGSNSNNDNDSNNDDSSNDDSNEGVKEYSWVDSNTGIDIFDYENVFEFEDDQETSIVLCPDTVVNNAIFLNSYEEVFIDKEVGDYTIESSSEYQIKLGRYALDPSYTYYAYYSFALGQSWDRIPVNGRCEVEGGTRYPYGLLFVGESDSYTYTNEFRPSSAGEYNIFLENGWDGSGPLALSDTAVYVRLIAVPN